VLARILHNKRAIEQRAHATSYATASGFLLRIRRFFGRN